MPYPILQLKPKRDKSILNRHPWIFSGAINKAPKAEEGDIIQVRSVEDKILGYGFYSSKSQISCRLLEFGDASHDFESVDYWFQKLLKAYSIRQKLVVSPITNAYRLVHAEGDFLPGIIIDIYANVAVGQILVKGIENRKTLIVEALQKLGFQNIYIKSKISSHVLEDIQAEPGWEIGNIVSPVEIIENGLKFKVDFVGGQKTGFFIDQRDSRQLVKQFSQDKKVLNTFSYTGGFSIYALAGGANEVHSVDISKDAVAAGDENVKLNFPDANHKSFAADCFEYLKEMPENYYDIIILDPPAFAKNARAVTNAARGYKQINLQAFRRIKPGGLVFTFSCSQNISTDLFRKIIFGAAADAHRNVRVIYQLHQPVDHPISIFHPEGEYLKGLVLEVE